MDMENERVDAIILDLFRRCVDDLRKMDDNGQPELFLSHAPAVMELMIKRFYDLPWILQDEKEES